MSIVISVLVSLVALLHVVLTVAARDHTASLVVFAAAAFLLVWAALARWFHWDGAWPVLIVGLLLAVAGPLVHGAMIGEFFPLHHLIRIGIVAVIAVVALLW